MNSNNFSWLTCLTITEHRPQICFRRPDVINISRLRNLVALDIGSSTTSFAVGSRNDVVEDSVIRNWGRLVHETQSFPKLQVLVVRNQPGVTLRSLRYLNAFPSLALFGVKECFEVSNHVEKAAKCYGWTSIDEHDIMAQVKRDITQSSTWDEPIRQCFKRASALLPPTTTTDAPLLNFRLGPTPSGILFNDTYSPLVFFRCLRCSTSQRLAVVPIISDPNPTGSNTQAQPQETTAKRRKLQRQLDLGGYFDEMLADITPDSTKSEAVTPAAVPSNGQDSSESWSDHRAVRARSQIYPSTNNTIEQIANINGELHKTNEGGGK